MKKPINLFGRVLCALVLCAGLVVTGCYDDSAIKDQYKEIDDRLDNLEGVQIKSLNDQMSSINVSLKSLESMDAALKKFIEDLEDEAADLQAQLNDNATADAATKKALEDEIANIKTLIEALQAKDTELDQKISDLKTYVDNELKSTEDWANATFATLTQYDGVQTEIATIKELIEQHRTEITAAYTKAIEDAIAASETSMKAWVNETLANGYYDIATVDGKLEALENELLASDNILAEQIIAQQEALDQAKTELTEAYKAAIEEAINTNNGVIRGEIASAIAEAKDELETKISAIETRLTEIESRLSDVEQKIEEILSMILSVAYMPEYSDGVTYVDATEKTAEMSFKISPSSAIAALEDVWSQALSVKYITTAITKAAPVMKDLSITSAEFDKELGTISLIVNCENLDATFFEGSNTASAALFISDGTSSVSSEFVNLQPSFDIDNTLSHTSDITSLSFVESTVTSVTFTGTALHPTTGFEVGVFCSTDPDFTVGSAIRASTFEFDSQKGFTLVVPSLEIDTQYYYCLFTVSNGDYKYGETRTFRTSSASVEVECTETTARFDFVSGVTEKDSVLEYGIIYSRETTPVFANSTKLVGDFSRLSVTATDLLSGVVYYYRVYYYYKGEYFYGDISSFMPPMPESLSATDLSSSETANCYIVDCPGRYQFKATKGNSSEALTGIAKTEVLWESFGTSTTPVVGDLISSVKYTGVMVFDVTVPFTEGNAVIAAKDASGKILWSWHIWLTDQPEGQVYNNNAGTMMDRNLGATSATPGDIGALGLLYQWGRKDPFLGSSSISSNAIAVSTLTWPARVSSDASTGTIDYVTANPTTYVYCSSISNDYDWHYGSRNNDLWKSEKTIYDPCPAGWRVPDGGDDGVWSTAGFDKITYDSTNKGISFSISSPSTTWYPASGSRNNYAGGLDNVGDYGNYWSVTPDSDYACSLRFYYDGRVHPSYYDRRAYGYAVRCLQE